LADNRVYLSCLTPCASTGNLTLYIETFDATPADITLTISCSGVAGQDEIKLATNIVQAINSALTVNSYVYDGTPAYNWEGFPVQFQAMRSDHVVTLWAQCQFRVTISNNAWSNIVQIDSTPTLCTVTEARTMSPVMGIDFEDNNENLLTDSQLATLLQISSSQLVRLINNNIVLGTQYHEEIGIRTGSIKLKTKPVLNFDVPQIRRPYILGITSMMVNNFAVSYQVDRRLGILNYRFTNDLMEISEPFDLNNEVKLTYRAGYMNIPRIIKEKTLIVCSNILDDISMNVSELKVGGFATKFFRPLDSLQFLTTELREYIL